MNCERTDILALLGLLTHDHNEYFHLKFLKNISVLQFSVYRSYMSFTLLSYLILVLWLVFLFIYFGFLCTFVSINSTKEKLYQGRFKKHHRWTVALVNAELCNLEVAILPT